MIKTLFTRKTFIAIALSVMYAVAGVYLRLYRRRAHVFSKEKFGKYACRRYAF